MILFGAFGVVGGLCALVLPDTVGFPLPNTFEDIEHIKKNSKPIWRCHTATNDDQIVVCLNRDRSSLSLTMSRMTLRMIDHSHYECILKASKTYWWFPTNTFDLSPWTVWTLDKCIGLIRTGVNCKLVSPPLVIWNFSVNYFDILTSLRWAATSSHHKVLLIGDYVSLDDSVITHPVSQFSRLPRNRS